jgi:hypothetical protein
VGQVVEDLPSKHKSLHSNPRITKEKKKPGSMLPVKTKKTCCKSTRSPPGIEPGRDEGHLTAVVGPDVLLQNNQTKSTLTLPAPSALQAPACSKIECKKHLFL